MTFWKEEDVYSAGFFADATRLFSQRKHSSSTAEMMSLSESTVDLSCVLQSKELYKVSHRHTTDRPFSGGRERNLHTEKTRLAEFKRRMA